MPARVTLLARARPGAWLAAGLLACGVGQAPPAAPSPNSATIVWRYTVTGDPGELTVVAELARGATGALRVDPDAAPFVHDVRFASGGSWTSATQAEGAWSIPCHDAGCQVRYRFALREAAKALDDVGTAIASGEGVAAPPSTWLLHPDAAPGRLHLEVRLTPPARFAAGMRAASDPTPGMFEEATTDLDDSSYAVFGPLLEGSARSGSSRIDVVLSPAGVALSLPEAVAWVQTSVDAIARYLGRFPPAVGRALVIVQRGRPGSPTRGATLGAGGPAVLVRVGEGVTAATTRDDWVMTHELLHVVLPRLSHEHVWLGEGIPSYVEPIARVRAGLVTPEKVWGDLVEGMPQGLPEAGDLGLERTQTWGRTYWGGALFCLMADVTLREKTRGARSFDDVVRALVAAGDDVETTWEIARMLDVGDRATGTTVLLDLYRTLALAPGTVDLPALWARLGVVVSEGRVTFDDRAPLASVRRGIAGR